MPHKLYLVKGFPHNPQLTHGGRLARYSRGLLLNQSEIHFQKRRWLPVFASEFSQDIHSGWDLVFLKVVDRSGHQHAAKSQEVGQRRQIRVRQWRMGWERWSYNNLWTAYWEFLIGITVAPWYFRYISQDWLAGSWFRTLCHDERIVLTHGLQSIIFWIH